MKSPQYYIRKTHRYLGLFIGIQFMLWVLGGLYFSWTNIDKIHGDHLVNFPNPNISLTDSLLSPNVAILKARLHPEKVKSLNLTRVLDQMVYQVETESSIILINAQTGSIRPPLSQSEAADFAKKIFKPKSEISSIEYITKDNLQDHYQYRGGTLPAWAISFKHPSNSVVYISSEKGSFEKIRNRQWRLYDFLWMVHIMDYQTRDNLNNWLLRGFSILGLTTVLSGFTLFYQSSRTIRTIKKQNL